MATNDASHPIAGADAACTTPAVAPTSTARTAARLNCSLIVIGT
jgi:hypothetical protein